MRTSTAVCLCLLPSLAIGPLMGQSRPVQTDKPLTVAQIVRQASDAVVQIVIYSETGKEVALASGFIVAADGKVVTNYHVIQGAHSAVAKLANGDIFPVTGALAVETDRDLVLLKLDGKALPFLTLDSTAALQVGDHVVAIGSPLGLQGTVSDGIVSALRREAEGKKWIQTTAPVSHGNSGGPLLDMRGKVIGVITSGVAAENGQNLNFAIPSEEVRRLLSIPRKFAPLGPIESAGGLPGKPSPSGGGAQREHADTGDQPNPQIQSASGAWACSMPAFNQKSFSALKQRAADGDVAAQCGLGEMFEFGEGVERDYAQAAVWFRKAAEQGNVFAQQELGWLYMNGEGVPQDYGQAAIWLRKAAEQGDTWAQLNLADIYHLGQGIPKDDTQAAYWTRRAAEQGDARGEDNLASLYSTGRGVPQDYVQAFIWFRKAAEKGYANAQTNVGWLFQYGKGVTQDYVQAALWYRRAADQGDPSAQLRLGLLYATGQGVPQDYAEAYFWFNLAAAGKLDTSEAEGAVTNRDHAAELLTAADLSREQERARKWVQEHPNTPAYLFMFR